MTVHAESCGGRRDRHRSMIAKPLTGQSMIAYRRTGQRLPPGRAIRMPFVTIQRIRAARSRRGTSTSTSWTLLRQLGIASAESSR